MSNTNWVLDRVQILSGPLKYFPAFYLMLAIAFPLHSAYASKFEVLYEFTGGSDGAQPTGALIIDGAGNLYGTGFTDGAHGYGTVFKLAPNGTESTLYSFRGGSDGANPIGGVIADHAGNLYGTTRNGGSGCKKCGTVFEVAADGTEKVLYAFKGGNDGQNPDRVIMDQIGNFYGVTTYGGKGCYGGGCGTVFEVAADGTETILYTFAGYPDGFWPYGSLAMDKSGNLFGTTSEGGVNCKVVDGCGTIFEVTSNGSESILYSFCSDNNQCTDGWFPPTGLALDQAGNLYGTTLLGGGSKGCGYGGCGTIFELSANLQETVLHAFQGFKKDGATPLGGVTLDGSGNLYGAACGQSSGCNTYGGKNCPKGCANGDAYKLIAGNNGKAPDTFQIVHTFDGKQGANPAATLLLHDRTLYGVTTNGGLNNCGTSGCGTVFAIGLKN